ncbi:hypothetical protein [Mycobacterium sp. TY813]|uniref:hypothetical protein n=1 Tax=Mycobacterium TaxID=1763 RepID=UPI0027406FDF|nr:hypothetical protein [Mycobacterium sp. TY813]MDP7731508.1 hypothetical protein [Mycobacterium sp. TY813]
MRPKSLDGGDAPYLPSVGKAVFDDDDLPPVTAAVRAAWGPHSAFPTATSEAMAALLVAVYTLETRLAAVESG